MSRRHLGRCGICSLAGERAADELFGCTTDGLDPDSLGDMIALDGIARDKAACEECPERERQRVDGAGGAAL